MIFKLLLLLLQQNPEDLEELFNCSWSPDHILGVILGYWGSWSLFSAWRYLHSQADSGASPNESNTIDDCSKLSVCCFLSLLWSMIVIKCLSACCSHQVTWWHDNKAVERRSWEGTKESGQCLHRHAGSLYPTGLEETLEMSFFLVLR